MERACVCRGRATPRALFLGRNDPRSQTRTHSVGEDAVGTRVVRAMEQGARSGVVCGPPGQVKPSPQTWQGPSGVAAK